ncbi:MAG TPA: HAD family hydrolase [Bryobacteraceae bacterium]|nr:HAD family hydrolase [Bryobacteraceae bacterium]
MSGRPAVFLDRDGTLMHEVGYCANPRDVAVYPGVREALERLREAGFALIVITNQSGIGLGYFTEAEYHAVQAELARQLAPVQIDGVYFSPDTPDSGSPRRKPAPGMIYEAARDHGIDLARSYFVGDREGDMQCGARAGLRTVLVETGYGAQFPDCSADYRARDFRQAVEWILEDARRE